jgi:hypothetical protein
VPNTSKANAFTDRDNGTSCLPGVSSSTVLLENLLMLSKGREVSPVAMNLRRLNDRPFVLSECPVIKTLLNNLNNKLLQNSGTLIHWKTQHCNFIYKSKEKDDRTQIQLFDVREQFLLIA